MRLITGILCGFWLLLASVASLAAAPEHSSAALRARHDELRDRLTRSPFGRPVHLVSTEEQGNIRADTYAVVERPFREAGPALAEAAQWCEVLMLPFNVKHCEAPSARTLSIYVGRKFSTPLSQAQRLEFRFDPVARSDDYLHVVLNAATGPFGTHDYRVELEAVPAPDNRTFIHLHYSYGYGALARFAMQTYLSTIGRDKVGFSVEGTDDQGKPALVRGLRGVMERNTMRYLLAIEAYLRALSVPDGQRPAKMAADWFTAVERYPLQLHELERGEYLAMKESEYRRMRAALSPARRTASSSPLPS